MGDFDRNLLVGGSTEFFYQYSDAFERSTGILLFLVLFFAILPDFHGVSSWLSMASVLGLIGGSLQVAAYGEMWYRRKNRG